MSFLCKLFRFGDAGAVPKVVNVALRVFELQKTTEFTKKFFWSQDRLARIVNDLQNRTKDKICNDWLGKQLKSSDNELETKFAP